MDNFGWVEFVTDDNGEFFLAGSPGHEQNSCGSFADGSGYGGPATYDGVNWSCTQGGASWCGDQDHAEPWVVCTGDFAPSPTPTPTPTPSPETKCNDDRVGGNQPSSSSCTAGGASGGAGSVGMARYSVHSMLVSLRIQDTPLNYSPGYGPTAELPSPTTKKTPSSRRALITPTWARNGPLAGSRM